MSASDILDEHTGAFLRLRRLWERRSHFSLVLAMVDNPLARAFEVVDVMPIKALKSYLRARGVGSLEILKRGVDLDPDQFRKTLKLKGAGAATVILTRVLGKHSAIVCHRVGRRV